MVQMVLSSLNRTMDEVGFVNVDGNNSDLEGREMARVDGRYIYVSTGE